MQTSFKQFKKNNSEKLMTISECSEKYNITRQTIHLAITKNRLKAKKIEKVWKIKESDWKEYEANKYNPLFKMANGKYLYGESEGKISPSMLSKLLNVDMNHIYFLLRKNIIPHERVNVAYVIDRNTALAMKNIITDRKSKKNRK